MSALLEGVAFGVGAFLFIALPYLLHWGGAWIEE